MAAHDDDRPAGDPALPPPPPPPAGDPAPPPPPPPAPRLPGSRLVAVLLAAAALVAALITTRASFASNDAGTLWQQALRQEAKAAAGVVEDIRYTYTVEGRQAFRYAISRVREEEFRTAASSLTGPARDAVLLEADVQKRLADGIRSSSEVAGDPRYALPSGGYDLVLRLADSRARFPDLVALDPDATDAQGEPLAAKARSLMLTTIPIGLAFMFGALAQAFVARRRVLLVLGAGALMGAALLAALVELLT